MDLNREERALALRSVDRTVEDLERTRDDDPHEWEQCGTAETLTEYRALALRLSRTGEVAEALVEWAQEKYPGDQDFCFTVSERTDQHEPGETVPRFEVYFEGSGPGEQWYAEPIRTFLGVAARNEIRDRFDPDCPGCEHPGQEAHSDTCPLAEHIRPMGVA